MGDHKCPLLCEASNENHPQTHRVIFILYLVCLLDLRSLSITEKRASGVFESVINYLFSQDRNSVKEIFFLSVKEEKYHNI